MLNLAYSCEGLKTKKLSIEMEVHLLDWNQMEPLLWCKFQNLSLLLKHRTNFIPDNHWFENASIISLAEMEAVLCHAHEKHDSY